MAHHEDSHDHGHDMTEGNRQYYPSGWHIPLIGLFVVAFFFALGAGALLGISGTDKWGKTEMCTDGHCDGHCGMDHANMTEGHIEGDHTGTTTDVIKENSHQDDSTAVVKVPAADCTQDDSAHVEAVKPVEGEHK